MITRQKNRQNVQVVIRQIDYPVQLFLIRPNDIGPFPFPRHLKRVVLIFVCGEAQTMEQSL